MIGLKYLDDYHCRLKLLALAARFSSGGFNAPVGFSQTKTSGERASPADELGEWQKTAVSSLYMEAGCFYREPAHPDLQVRPPEPG